MSTTDMTPVIVPKSDQISADDFISGPKTYTIDSVHISPGTEQPVNINMVGETRAWRPCKSMSRVLVAAWGPDAKVYAGRSVTLYRDPTVKWGGMEVGGIRISHMSHIERDMLLQLSVTKGKRAPTVIKPLIAEVKPIANAKQTAEQWAAEHIGAVQVAASLDSLANVMAKGEKAMARLETTKPELHAEVNAAYAAARIALEPEGKPDEDRGEPFTDEPDFGGE